MRLQKNVDARIEALHKDLVERHNQYEVAQSCRTCLDVKHAMQAPCRRCCTIREPPMP